MVSSSNITMFKSLNINNSNFILQGRVIRLWRMPVISRPTDTHSVEIILMDKEGSKIQVSIDKRYLKSELKKYLQEGISLQISGASLARNETSVKFCDNLYKVIWNWSTKVNACADIGVSINGLSFASFQDLEQFKLPFNVSFDICGYLTNVGEVTPHKVYGKDSNAIMMTINDIEGTTLDLTLWNEYCDQLTNYIRHNPTIQPLVVTLQFAKYKEWKGKASLSNMYYGSKLLINTDSKEIEDLKQSLLARIDCGSILSQSLSCESVVHNVKNEFLVMNAFNCIAEINMLKKVQTVILLGTIKSIEKDSRWHYLGCSYCMRKVDEAWTLAPKSAGSFENVLKSEKTCGSEKCKTRNTSVFPRYRITVTLQDPTGVCFLTLFDPIAIKLLNISATDLMSLYGKDHESDVFWPTELEALVDKKLAFKVEVTQYNKDKPSNYFKVLKTTDDTEVIEQLDQKLMELKDGESFSFDIDDQQTINLKESVSFTGQNETPGTVSYKDSGKDAVFVGGVDGIMSSSSGLKRNLNEVYDVDEYEANSSTKARNNSKEGLDHTPTQKLLIPKMEKE